MLAMLPSTNFSSSQNRWETPSPLDLGGEGPFSTGSHFVKPVLYGFESFALFVSLIRRISSGLLFMKSKPDENRHA